VHQVGDQPRLYYDSRSTSYQDVGMCFTLVSGNFIYFVLAV